MIREGRHIKNPDMVISIQSKTGLKMIFDNEKIITETLVYPDTKTTVIKAKAVRWWHKLWPF